MQVKFPPGDNGDGELGVGNRDETERGDDVDDDDDDLLLLLFTDKSTGSICTGGHSATCKVFVCILINKQHLHFIN